MKMSDFIIQNDLSKVSINKLLELLEKEIIVLQSQLESQDFYLEHTANKARIEGEIIERVNQR
jgi:hypothetical protein